MPVDALRSVSAHIDDILRHVSPKRLVSELRVADRGLHFRFFKGYRPEKIGRGRIKKLVDTTVLQGEGNVLVANLIIVHWNDRHARLYREMVAHVQEINEDVEAIEQIEDDAAHRIIDDMLQRHEPKDVLLCVRLNGVRFRDEVIEARLVRGEPAPEPGAAPTEGEAEAAEEPGDTAAGSEGEADEEPEDPADGAEGEADEVEADA